jgi:hypothetical protein
VTLSQTATDFGFHHWEGDFWDREPGAEETDPTVDEVTFCIHQNSLVGAVFAEYTGASSLDLLADLYNFIGYAGLSGTVETVDMNDTDFTPETMLMQNGMPDAAELFLLQTALQDFDVNIKGGVCHQPLWYDWHANLALAEADLAGIVDPGVRATVTRVVAALMTLGDYGSIAMAEDTVDLAFGIPLDCTEYRMAWWDVMSHKGDADADGYTNTEEWAVVMEDTSLTTGAQRREAYVAAALTPGLHGTGGYAPASGGMSMLPGGAGCPIQFEIAYGTDGFSAEGHEYLDLIPWPEPPQGPVGSASPTGLVDLGQRVTLSAPVYVDCYKFSGWYSDTLRVNGITTPAFSFLPENSGTVHAGYTTIRASVMTDQVEIRNSDTLEILSGQGHVIVAGPPGEILTLRATHPAARGWYFEAVNDYNHNEQRTVSVYMEGDSMTLGVNTTGPEPGPDDVATSGYSAMGGHVVASYSPTYGALDAQYTGKVQGRSGGYFMWRVIPEGPFRFEKWSGTNPTSSVTRSIHFDESTPASDRYGAPELSRAPRYTVQWEAVSVEQEAPFKGKPGYVEVLGDPMFTDPLLATFPAGTPVRLTAMMQPGHKFIGWGGNAYVRQNGVLFPISDPQFVNQGMITIEVQADTKVTAKSRFGFPGAPIEVVLSQKCNPSQPLDEPMWSGTDECGNTVSVRCQGSPAAYSVYYNSALAAKCLFP